VRIVRRAADPFGSLLAAGVLAWIGFQVVRFYVEIPHEEIVFASGKWDITEKEEAKLRDPLRLLKDAASKYARQMDVKLYVAGHTDSVGNAKDNQVLSEKRARAIAAYFAEHGLSGVPILVRGFGEGALAVKTADNVAEAKNRRAQYIISSFTPEVPGPGAWQAYP
jgi:outer membrane protein OmpA-like peptidoglycan-associated protein